MYVTSKEARLTAWRLQCLLYIRSGTSEDRV